MFLYEREWRYRKPLVDAILFLLSDGAPRTARQISDSLHTKYGIDLHLRLVHCVLENEARRYVTPEKYPKAFRIRPHNINKDASENS